MRIVIFHDPSFHSTQNEILKIFFFARFIDFFPASLSPPQAATHQLYLLQELSSSFSTFIMSYSFQD